MKWTWESTNAGSTTFPLRLSSRVRGPLSSCKKTHSIEGRVSDGGRGRAKRRRDLDGLVGPDAEHAAATDGHGVGEGLGGVRGVDGAVGQHHVGEAVPRQPPCEWEERRTGQPLASRARGTEERRGLRNLRGKGRRTVAVAMATAATTRALWAADGNGMVAQEGGGAGAALGLCALVAQEGEGVAAAWEREQGSGG
jgi:hypothetical protein